MVKVIVCPAIVPEIIIWPVPLKGVNSMSPVTFVPVWLICHFICPDIMPPMLPLPIIDPPDSAIEPVHVPA